MAWFSYTLFTLYSGSKGVVITDTLMFLLFCVATVIFVFYIIDGFGGVSRAVTDLTHVESKPDIAAWHGTATQSFGRVSTNPKRSILSSDTNVIVDWHSSNL